MNATKTVLVTGDIVLDHHIYEGERLRLLDDRSRGVHTWEEFGGAAMTQKLIQEIFQTDPRKGSATWEARLAYQLPAEPPQTGTVPQELTSYVMWMPFDAVEGKDKAWRVERPLGYGTPQPVASLPWKGAGPHQPDILVLDDAGAGFRNAGARTHWHLQKAALPQWVVLKLSGSPGRGDLWDEVQNLKLQDRLVIVVSIESLRRMEAQLNPGLSWEQAAEQLARALAYTPSLAPLRSCRHLIVNFGLEGAAWFQFARGKASTARLVFDVEHVEREWSERIAGEAFGAHICLTAAVVNELARAVDTNGAPECAGAIKHGLSAMRRLRAGGHGVVSPQPPSGYPRTVIASEILNPTYFFGEADIPLPAGKPAAPDSWSILGSSQGSGNPAALLGFARQIALRGEPAMRDIPYLKIRKLLTPSRAELESLRILKRTMREFKESKQKPKPLSIGVFGPPGAGKSFAVRELATGIFCERCPKDKDYEGWMEFNLAQFKDPEDLIGAFHQVRDRVLDGLVPVVFWDEFDSRSYFWLQYLLAPMQDGKFQEGQITHPIGKCVFIFAGATASSFEEFGEFQKPGVDARELREMERHFRLAKGPDFKSRLDAALNVLGPNPVQKERPKRNSKAADEGPFRDDPFCPIRRAIMIRGQLGCEPNEYLDIDNGLLTALLEVSSYKHGARSLDKLLAPLKAARKEGRPARRSLLASPRHLQMYVDADEFYKLCDRDDQFRQSDIVERIAPAIHEGWRDIARREKWKPTYDVPYAELAPPQMRANEAAARRMPDILALVGLHLVRGAATAAEEKAVRRHLELHIELLGEAEHEGWMSHQRSEGWRYAEKRDDQAKLHNCLVPYRELSEKDRNKDRNSVLHYPDFARRAGWKIVFA
jgi:hypothetical protein